ncbi:MAG: hypothetical protein H7834_12460 [Magnetococcus sp. YQC-9]
MAEPPLQLKVTVGEQPIHVAVGEQPILATLSGEPLHVALGSEGLNIATPVVLQSLGGWPFGENPKRVSDILRDSPMVLDRVAMPGQYRVVEWLLAIHDSANGLAVGCRVLAIAKGGGIEFTEYAITGDADRLVYEIDCTLDGDEARLLLTSRHEGPLVVNVMKIGVFA